MSDWKAQIIGADGVSRCPTDTDVVPCVPVEILRGESRCQTPKNRLPIYHRDFSQGLRTPYTAPKTRDWS